MLHSRTSGKGVKTPKIILSLSFHTASVGCRPPTVLSYWPFNDRSDKHRQRISAKRCAGPTGWYGCKQPPDKIPF